MAATPLSRPNFSAQKYQWSWQGQSYSVAYQVQGSGAPLLLLPALSTVSTRHEMQGIADQLSGEFQVFILDWLGFGDSDRPPLDYQPALYLALVQDFVRSTFSTPVAVVAAGHGASYVMALAQQSPALWSKIALVSPTWRGPLPTVLGDHRRFYHWVRGVVRSPGLGQALYQLTTTPAFLGRMYRRHVYVNTQKVTPEFISQKRQTTQQPGARFGSAAFVTGALDVVQSPQEFLQWFQPLPHPVMLFIGEQTPPKSKAEMDALSSIPGMQVCRITGSLGMHEESPSLIATGLLPFLKDYLQTPKG